MASAIKQMKYVQLLMKNTQADVTTIQETKLNQSYTKHTSLHTYQHKLYSQRRRPSNLHQKQKSVFHNLIHQHLPH